MKKKNDDQTEDNNRMNPVEDIHLYAAGREADPAIGNGDDEFNESDVTPEDIALLDATGEDGDDEELEEAQLDDVDEEGEPLNEKTSNTDLFGKDLDVPGSEYDDEEESIGDEDEENNSYSMADDE